ncbi:MAG TPA: pyridoxamine 5'-phosphate oxidase family protein, partial [Saprospiraceae bacterium]|nr:pyridoxamine 5'-phosphate oxidase family protein [Saprospiraceae bacterium]
TFISKYKHAVVSTVTADQHSESAVVGIVVTPDLKIFFDTSNGSRKFKNIMSNPSTSVVVWSDEQTAQLEGFARAPTGNELNELLKTYFQSFPDGRERQSWPDIAYVVVDVKWVKYSDFSKSFIKEIRV